MDFLFAYSLLIGFSIPAKLVISTLLDYQLCHENKPIIRIYKGILINTTVLVGINSEYFSLFYLI